jgi:type IV pilus assembly protein PilF
MKRAFVLLMVGMLSACVTETVLVPMTQRAANLEEAAQLNAQLGMDYLRNSELGLAKEKFTRAIEQNNDNVLAHSGMALVYQREGDVERAEKAFRRAMSISDEDPNLRSNFGAFLCSRNQIREGLKWLQTASRDPTQPNAEAALFNQGVCHMRGQDYDRAEEVFRDLLVQRPQSAAVLTQLASISYHRKDPLKVRAFVQRAVKIQPTALLLALAADAEQKLGDNAAALSYRKQLRKDFPEAGDPAELLQKALP